MNRGLKQWPEEVTVFLRSIRQEHGVAAEVRVLRDLRRLADKRHRLRDITDSLGHGLFELITSHHKMEYRCIYAFHHPEIVVLVCFVKKTRKTPPAKIELARNRNALVARGEVHLGDVTLH
jgi:phage-related protein